MEPTQAQRYESALRSLITDVRATDEQSFQRQALTFMARRTAMLQICSNPVLVDPSYLEIPAKLAAIDSILDELVTKRNEKVVIWSFFRGSIQALMNRYQRFSPVLIDGSVADTSVRREAVRRFQEDENTKLFIGNPAAAGAGITLHRARYAIYESFSNQAAHYLQSLDRIHRRGQKRAVEYLILLCDRTIELKEYERLLRKEQSAQDLLGDDAALNITRESFLNDAMEAAALLGLGAMETG
jgi:SNF2 family DNA or RNA helicase